MKKPGPDEYNSFYETYVSLVPEGDVVAALASQGRQTETLLAQVPEEHAGHRYAPGKWSVREVAGHMVDTERVMSYRALCVARGEQGPLPRFDENAYVQNAGFDARPLSEHIEDFRVTRQATLRLLASIDDATSLRRGTASGFTISVRALAYIIAGHELHHRNILRDRYGLK